MKNRLLLFSFYLLGTLSLLAQPAPSMKWGKFSPEKGSTPFDKEAEAVILGDYGTWRPHPVQEGMVMLTRHVRIKILKQSAVSLAEQEIRYRLEGETESIYAIRAQTINWRRGKKEIDKLSLDRLPPDTINPQWAAIRFHFRDVKPGSIIEYEYSLISRNVISLQPWYFQSRYPTVWSQIKLVGFGEDAYHTVVSGRLPAVERKQGWSLKYIPALPEESFSSSYHDQQAMIRFQWKTPYLIPTETETIDLNQDSIQQLWTSHWQTLQQDTRQADEAASIEAMQALVSSLTRDATTEEEKVAQIYEHVRDHFNWNGIRTTWLWRRPSDIYRSARGNAAEINSLLFHLLQMAGITTRICMIRSREAGPPHIQEPLVGQFDHLVCVAKAEKRFFYLDATDPLRPYYLPDPSSLNGYGYLLQEKESAWFKIPEEWEDKQTTLVQFQIKSDQQIVGEVQEFYHGYTALPKLMDLQTLAPPAFWEQHQPILRRKQTTDDVQEGFRLETEEGGLRLFYPLQTDTFVQVIGDRYFLSPMLSFGLFSSPFPAGERIRPIDFRNHQQREYACTFFKPDGYVVESLPVQQQLSLNNGAIQFRFLCQEEGDVIMIRSQLEIKEARFWAEEYTSIRQLFRAIADAHTERIVLRKVD